jgi:glycosyltransferase involved in cell wall biosynthesis
VSRGPESVAEERRERLVGSAPAECVKDDRFDHVDGTTRASPRGSTKLSSAPLAAAPDISIVMCVWKPRVDWFRQAVASALEQRGCTLELVVVDDGSPEPVESLLRDVEDPRLRIVRVEHNGLANARNAGTAAATGRYFRFVDGDDVLERDSCARLVALTADGANIAYGTTMICDADLRPLGAKQSRLDGWAARECVLYRFDVRHMSMVFPRSVVEAVGDWDVELRQCQDWDFVLRALEHAPVRGEPDVATYYRRHGASASANVEGALHYESMVVDRYFERHPHERGSSLEREARAKLLMVRARAARTLGGTRATQLGLTRKAFALHPRRTTEEIAQLAVELGRRVARSGSAD